MSIIQEALKKIQNVEGDKKSPDKDAPPIRRELKEVPSPSPLPATSKRVSGLTVFLIIIFFITFGFAIKEFLSAKKFWEKSKDSAKIDTVDTSSRQEITYKPMTEKVKAELPQQTEAEQYPRLTLNGIMYLEKKPQAIINGSIVEEGNVIEGAKIVKINRGSVVLDFKNVEITLSLRK